MSLGYFYPRLNISSNYIWKILKYYTPYLFSGEHMTKKDEFVIAFKGAADGKHPKEFKNDLEKFTKILNSNIKLRGLFHEAVEEAETTKDDPAMGLSGLFKGFDQ